MAMLSFDEARARILSDVPRVDVETVTLARAAGRVLARDLDAETPLPRFDHSAMDGYAVATTDLDGEGPWTLPVIGESAAGAGSRSLALGAACRIFTGAPIPTRADAVVMQENVRRDGDAIVFAARPRAMQHVRRTGEDMRAGVRAIAAGTRLGAGHLALAAMLDRADLVVARRPVVTILSTGNELRAPGTAGTEGSIPESNSVALAALAEQAGASVRVAPIARDDAEATVVAILEALRGTDLLLTVGGVSVGDHDLVRPALERAGVTLDFWRVAIKPGKPLAVGRTANARVLGLPGNPASAMVTFAVFGLPLLRAMQGDARPIAPFVSARLANAQKRSPDRLELARVTLEVVDGAFVARTHTNQSSGAATSLADSNALAMLPPGESPLAMGALVDVVRWSDL